MFKNNELYQYYKLLYPQPMNPLEYIALFKSLQHITHTLIDSSIDEDFKEFIVPIINNLVNDILEILTICKRYNYNIFEDERREYQQRLRSRQKQIDDLVVRLSIYKECSKCKRRLPATTKFFYNDMSARGGLRPECKKCHNNAKKEFYNKNK